MSQTSAAIKLVPPVSHLVFTIGEIYINHIYKSNLYFLTQLKIGALERLSVKLKITSSKTESKAQKSATSPQNLGPRYPRNRPFQANFVKNRTFD